jgi:pilus assembly protein Flp/PilA
MIRIRRFFFRLLKERMGQDMVEYALLAGFVAVSGGALLPGVSESVSTIFSRLDSVLTDATGGGNGGGGSPTSAPRQ